MKCGNGLITFSDDERMATILSIRWQLSLIEDSDDEEEDGKYSHLSEQAATFVEGLDKGAIAIRWYHRLAQFQAKGRLNCQVAANIVTELYIKDMPGTSLTDVPGGLSNEEDIEFDDEIITSDEEERKLHSCGSRVEKYAGEDVKNRSG